MSDRYGSDPTQEPVERRMVPLIAAQYGVFSLEQALRMGATNRMIRRRVATGRWHAIYRNVFRIAGSPPSWRQSLVAECLAWGRGAVASHRAAAAIWELPGFGPGVLEITVPRNRRRSQPRDAIVHWRPPLPPADVTVVNAIPITAPARTLIDIASVAARDVVEEALDDALRRKLVSLPRMRWRLAELGHSGRPGIAAIRSLLAARDSSSLVPESVFETRLLRIFRDTGLPKPVLQHRVIDRGRLVAILDFAFPSARVAIEAEGYRWHSGRARWEHDLARRNILTSLGWRVVHVTWSDISSNRRELVQRIEKVLAEASRGQRSAELARLRAAR
jgi:very-short-patch-repair endonuclease